MTTKVDAVPSARAVSVRSGGQPAEHEQSGEGQQDRPRERRERDGATRYTSAVGGEGLRHGLSLPQRRSVRGRLHGCGAHRCRGTPEAPRPPDTPGR